jgi:putative endonuclease
MIKSPHNAGRTAWTKRARPWVRVLLEEQSDRQTAVRRERYLKSGWGRRWLTAYLHAGRPSVGSSAHPEERLPTHNAGRTAWSKQACRP